MPKVDLLPELWEQVISHLHRPLPIPTGRSDRTAVHQSDLASCMGVSKMWNDIAARHLYRVVLTCHPPTLLQNLRSPRAAKHIKSKVELLGLVKYLHLEYFDKAEPSYHTLLRHGAPMFALIHPSKSDLITFCGAESDWIADAAEAMKGTIKDIVGLSTGAHFGGQRHIWHPMWALGPADSDMPNRMGRARKAISWIASLEAEFFCHRVEYGPLTYASSLWNTTDYSAAYPKVPKALEHRMHLDGIDPAAVPTVTGGHSVWYCPLQGVESDEAVYEATTALCQAAITQVGNRERSRAQLADDPSNPLPLGANSTLSLDIYLPHFANTQTKPFMKRTIKNSMAQWYTMSKIPKSYYANDSCRLLELKNAPDCPACFWRSGYP